MPISSRAIVLAATTLLLSVSPVSDAAEVAVDSSQAGVSVQRRGDVKPPKSPRLRFRSGGPACMCVSGMSEAEIAAAAQRRREQSDTSLDTIVEDP